MSNVRHIAREAGVSITTVSRVLNNHPRVSDVTREKVLAVANKARYVPSVGKRSNTTISLVYTGDLAIGNPFDAALLQGVTEAMDEFSFDLILLDVRRACQLNETYSQMFIRRGIRGAVLRSTAMSRGVARLIANEGYPAVILGDRFDHPTMRFVGSESGEASREAVEHLIGLGHRHIGVVTNIEDDCDHLDRLAGYRQALEDADLSYDPALVYRVPAHREAGATFMNRFESMSNRPTALFFFDSITVIAALSQAVKLGISVPDDLSVVGFDDQEWRYMVYPNVTSVCQDVVSLGRRAFQELHDIILDKEPDPANTARAAWLEVHQTTAPPRDA